MDGAEGGNYTRTPVNNKGYVHFVERKKQELIILGLLGVKIRMAVNIEYALTAKKKNTILMATGMDLLIGKMGQKIFGKL